MLIKIDQDQNIQAPKRPKAAVGFILDGSASMTYYKEETIRGFNWYLRDLKNELSSDAHIKMGIFRGDKLEIASEGDLIYSLPLNRVSYQTFGNTPLYDSVMSMITKLDVYLLTSPDPKPIVVIQTDGEDTSSKVKPSLVRNAVSERTSQGWQFVLIAMGVNGERIGASMGINPGQILDYKTGNIIQAFKSVARLTERAVEGEKARFLIEDRRAQG